MPPKQKAPKRRDPDGSLSQEGEDQQPGKKEKMEKMEVPTRGEDGKLYFVLKQKPGAVTMEDLEKAPNQTLAVKDIRTYPARKVVQSMQEGDEVLLYQMVKQGSKEQPGVTGLCSVARAPYEDPEDSKWLAFDLRLEEAFDKRISLSNMKKYSDTDLRGCTLFTSHMLQVHWLMPEQFNFLLEIPEDE